MRSVIWPVLLVVALLFQPLAVAGGKGSPDALGALVASSSGLGGRTGGSDGGDATAAEEANECPGASRPRTAPRFRHGRAKRLVSAVPRRARPRQVPVAFAEPPTGRPAPPPRRGGRVQAMLQVFRC